MLNVIKNGAQLSLDSSGNLLVNVASGGGSGSNPAASATGSAVPASADYLGVNIAGSLTGLTGVSLTNAKAAAVAIVDGSGNQITSFGGGTQYSDGTTQATPTGTAVLGKNPSNVLHALSIDSSGNLNVNLTANSFGTVTVSGTVTANQGTSPWVSNISQVGGSVVVTGTGVSGAGIPRVTVSSDSFPATQAISGTVTANAGSGTFATSLATLPALVAGSANIGGVEIVDSGGTNKLAVNASGQIAVSNFPATQPVSIAALPALVAGAANIGGVEIIDSGGVNKLAVNASGQLAISNFPASQSVSVSGTVQDVSDGLASGTPPAYATQVAGSCGTWLRVLNTDASGNLQLSQAGGLADILTQLLLEARATRAAIVSIATDGGRANPMDFDPSSYESVNSFVN